MSRNRSNRYSFRNSSSISRRILLLLLIVFNFGHASAQQRLSSTPKGLTTSHTDTQTTYYAGTTEPPRAIKFKDGTVTTTSFLANINSYFKIPAEFTFKEGESNSDNLGIHHRLLNQYYKGIPLEGMGYRVHEKGGFVKSVNGKAVRNIKLNTQVTLSEKQAFYAAANYLNTKDTTFRHGKLLIVSKGLTFAPESFFVVYQFDIDVSLIERWRISIDVHKGYVVNKMSLVNTCNTEAQPSPFENGTGLTNYYGIQNIQIENVGNSWRLVGQTQHGGNIGTYNFNHASLLALLFGLPVPVYDFYSTTKNFEEPYQKAAVSVQWAAEQAYEYYYSKHNRNSFDNKGGAITSYVHVDNGLDNAFWTGRVLAFGDGSNNNPLVELDVVAHELTHGVTQNEAQLYYYYEPGALNESFSDILAKAVEFNTFGDTATWQMGKHYLSGGIRDFSNPNVKNQADTYAGDLWYTGSDDSGGVHSNSGVQNFWFYLLCEGGSGVNDHQMSYSINPIGIDDATKITYRNLTEYLSPYSDYLDSRIGSMFSAADLYGENSAIQQEVDKAWDAVGVVDEPIITSLELFDITATTVKIKGSLIPRGEIVTYHFEYGTTLAYGNSSSIYNYVDKVEGTLTGLQSQTKYYLRLVATNENGTSYFSKTFTTISLAPLVKIKYASDVTENSATFRGQVNPNSLATSYYFEYGITSSLGSVTPSYPMMTDTTEFLNVQAIVTGLQPRKTYYYRMVATNGFASSVTGIVNFYTAAKPIVSSFAPVSAQIDSVITITGLNFNTATEKNLVNFGATRGTVVSASSTEIKVKVPAGASVGSISVLDAESALMGESIEDFVPTFKGEFKKGSLQLRAAITDPYVWRSQVHDMDGDNKPDIVSIHYQGFSVFLNVNQGGDITAESFIRSTFNSPVIFTSDGFRVIDLDGDGRKDVVVRSQEGGLLIYQNLSVPGYIFFGTPIVLNIPWNNYWSEYMFADFDLDGHIDFANAVSRTSDSTIFMIFKNQNPKGVISALNFELQYSKVLPYYLEYVAVDDVNNDGTPDLIASANNKRQISVMRNNSQPGTFDFEESVVPDLDREDRFVCYSVQDLNQDGRKDFISYSPSLPENLRIMQSKGSSPDISIEASAVIRTETEATALNPVDMDGDGKVDLMAALSKRQFILLKNKTGAGEHLSTTSFEEFQTYGEALQNSGSGTADTRMVINDLNGDGRPDVINSYSYNFGPHDLYQMEIWQNSPNSCIDLDLIKVEVSKYSATVLLPPNTTFDQFEIDVREYGSTYWSRLYSTTMNYLYSGYKYELRVRAKCYLSFTDYYYTTFITDCIDLSSFTITKTNVTSIDVYANELSSIEVQYSLKDQNQWMTMPQYSSQITNLLPGTAYDLRYRGRCNAATEFTYKDFITLCPKLSSLTITGIAYNKAKTNWTSGYPGVASIEYSSDNITWTDADYAGFMFPLKPATKYFVRGNLECRNSNSDKISTSFTTLCPEVSLLNVNTITPFGGSITWNDESATGDYTVTYVRTAGSTIATEHTTSTSFDLVGLSPGTEYKVGVAPQCTNQKIFSYTTFSTVCYAPVSLVTTTVTTTTAELSWNDNFGGVPYSIEYAIAGSNVWYNTNSGVTSVSLSQLRPGTAYEVRVHITCLDKKAPNASLHFETSLYDETKYAPNPTSGKVTISPSKNLIGSNYSIHDAAGKKIVSGKVLDYTFDFTDFYSGIYILQIDGEKLIKIVKY